MSRSALVLLVLTSLACASSTRRVAPADGAVDLVSEPPLPDVAPDDVVVRDATEEAPDDVAPPRDLPPDDPAPLLDAPLVDAPLMDALPATDGPTDASDDPSPDRAVLSDVPADTTACASDADCPVGTFCEAPGRCVPWRCFPGQTHCISSTQARTCDARGSGTVERACGDGCERDVCMALSACDAPRRRCGALCVDVANDPNHCGACGRACAAGCLCGAGSCACSCAGSSTVCSGTCRDLSSDASHCGRCGVVCSAGQVCLAGVCRAPPTLTPLIASLQTVGCTVRDHAAHNGRDRGGLAISPTAVVHNGSARAAPFALDTLAPLAPFPVAHDGLVSDLTTGALYTVRDGFNIEFPGRPDAPDVFRATRLTWMPTTTLERGSPVQLPRAVTLHHDAGFFSSWRHVVLYSGGVGSARAWHVISTLTGRVETFPAADAPLPHATCPNGAWWGIAERTADGPRVVYLRDRRTVVRTSLTDHRTEVLATVPDLGDACAITASSRAGRWYFHHTGPSSFAPSGAEVTGACPATFTAAP